MGSVYIFCAARRRVVVVRLPLFCLAMVFTIVPAPFSPLGGPLFAAVPAPFSPLGGPLFAAVPAPFSPWSRPPRFWRSELGGTRLVTPTRARWLRRGSQQ